MASIYKKLKQVKCSNAPGRTPSWESCDQKRYEEYATVQYKGVTLKKEAASITPFAKLRLELLESLETQLKLYFPEEDLKDYNVLSPKDPTQENFEIKSCQSIGNFIAGSTYPLREAQENFEIESCQSIGNFISGSTYPLREAQGNFDIDLLQIHAKLNCRRHLPFAQSTRKF